MQAVAIQTLSQAEFSWLDFFALLGAVILGVAVVVLWRLAFQGKPKRKRRHPGHGRTKPTLAEMGGLPPKRSHDEQAAEDDPPFDP
jgi:hypothetical protein